MRKYAFDHPLDSPQRTLAHREIIRNKKALRSLYQQWYQLFIKELDNLPCGFFIELGSGGGFLKDIDRRFICTDILDLPTNDVTFSALDMPFKTNSVGGIFMIDTMHHIPDGEKFLLEAFRVLMPGGKILMIEPANSWWGRLIYTRFHHEPFDPSTGWTIPESGPMSGANGALPWIIFERDYPLFEKKYPGLKVEAIQYINPLAYLFSGGVSRKQFLPDFLFPLIYKLDQVLPRISKQLSMFMLVRIKKSECQEKD